VPELPTYLTVEEGYVAFLEGRAVGRQNYICLPAAGGFKWTFTGPQATLFLSPRGELQQEPLLILDRHVEEQVIDDQSIRKPLPFRC